MEPQVQEYHLYTVNIFHTAPQDSLLVPLLVLFKAFHDIIEAYSCLICYHLTPHYLSSFAVFPAILCLCSLCPSLYLIQSSWFFLHLWPPLPIFRPWCSLLFFHNPLSQHFFYHRSTLTFSERNLQHTTQSLACGTGHSLIEFTSVSPA